MTQLMKFAIFITVLSIQIHAMENRNINESGNNASSLEERLNDHLINTCNEAVALMEILASRACTETENQNSASSTTQWNQLLQISGKLKLLIDIGIVTDEREKNTLTQGLSDIDKSFQAWVDTEKKIGEIKFILDIISITDDAQQQ